MRFAAPESNESEERIGQRLRSFRALARHAIYEKAYKQLGAHWRAQCEEYIRAWGKLDPILWTAKISRLFIDEPTSPTNRNIVFLLTAIRTPEPKLRPKGRPMNYATVVKTDNGYKILHTHKGFERAERIASRESTEKRPVLVAELNDKGEVARLAKKKGNGHTPARIVVKPGNEAAAKVLSAAKTSVSKGVESVDEAIEARNEDLSRLASKLIDLGNRLLDLDKESKKTLAAVMAKLGEVKKSA